MVRERTEWEGLADSHGIVEPHDEKCHGNELCREHFIEKLVEAEKAGLIPAGPIFSSTVRTPGGKRSGSVTICGEKEGKRTAVLERERQGTAALIAGCRRKQT